MRSVLMALVVAATGCGEDFTDCALGELTGTWRISWTEVDGTCGDLPDATVTMGTPTPSNCTTNARTISEDKCELDADMTCVNLDDSVQVVGHLEHVSADVVVGVETWTLLSPDGNCRSTYEVEMRRL